MPHDTSVLRRRCQVDELDLVPLRDDHCQSTEHSALAPDAISKLIQPCPYVVRRLLSDRGRPRTSPSRRCPDVIRPPLTSMKTPSLIRPRIGDRDHERSGRARLGSPRAGMAGADPV